MALPLRVGAQLYTVRRRLKTPEDAARSLRRIREMGYAAVQASGVGVDRGTLRRLLEENGLACAATHESWERLTGDLPGVIEDHRLLRCAHTALGAAPHALRNPEGYARIAREGSEAGRRLGEAGITFSYHHHAFEFERAPGGRSGMEILFEESVPAAFGFEIDTFWVAEAGEDPSAWLRRCKGRLFLVHLKDRVLPPAPGRRGFAEVGEGNLDWPAIFAASNEAGAAWHFVEQDECEGDPFDSLARSLANLRRMGIVPKGAQPES